MATNMTFLTLKVQKLNGSLSIFIYLPIQSIFKIARNIYYQTMFGQISIEITKRLQN